MIESTSRETVASELVVSVKAIDAFVQEEIVMPFDRQLCLALFAIERVPDCARAGHRLRGQVLAAIAFHTHETPTHRDGPPRLSWKQ